MIENIRYFEIEFGKRAELEDREYVHTPDRLFICIKADHYVTEKEVEVFCKVDMEANGYDTICNIQELSEEEALDSYDMSEELPILTSSGKKVYKIPVSYEMYGFVYIEADDLEDACSIAEEDDIPLPEDNADYVEGSWRVDWDVAPMFNEGK